MGEPCLSSPRWVLGLVTWEFSGAFAQPQHDAQRVGLGASIVRLLFSFICLFVVVFLLPNVNAPMHTHRMVLLRRHGEWFVNSMNTSMIL